MEEPADGERWLVPGFFDLQLNGFAGGDFISPSVSRKDVRHVAEAVLRTGTTRFLPTIITADLEVMCRQLAVIAEAIERDPLVGVMCPGIHVEGPFINPDDGPRGAHPREHVRPPNVPDFERLHTAALGRIALLTLAADQPGSAELIRHASAKGIVTAIGHHRPDAAALDAAVAAGARLCTHLGNGSDATMPRLDNLIWRQLGDDRLWASFIADGHHLPARTLRCMLRAKTLDRSILITDAVAAAGMPPGRYRLGEAEIELTSEGRSVLPGTPYLAGSAAQMPDVIANAILDGGLTFPQAVAAASLHPARLLNAAARWSCEPGQPSNLVELDWYPRKGHIRIRQAVIDRFASTDH
jgi:N-acetylglucosamine-6-phosphate deacetylase